VKSTVDHISRDVKQVANTQRELQQAGQQALHRLTTAQETSTNELKYLISQGFEQLTQKIAENKQLILRESANVISSQQRAIHELKEVTVAIFRHLVNFQQPKMKHTLAFLGSFCLILPLRTLFLLFVHKAHKRK